VDLVRQAALPGAGRQSGRGGILHYPRSHGEIERRAISRVVLYHPERAVLLEPRDKGMVLWTLRKQRKSPRLAPTGSVNRNPARRLCGAWFFSIGQLSAVRRCASRREPPCLPRRFAAAPPSNRRAWSAPALWEADFATRDLGLYCGGLSHHNYDNNTSRMLGRVLRRFAAGYQ
jgi:hypothetical protein